MLVTNIKCDSTWHFWQYMTFDSMWHFWQYTTKESPCITSLNSLFSHSKTPIILSGIFFHMFLKRVLVPGEIMFIFWQSFVSPWEVGDRPWSEGHVQLMDRLRMSASQRGRGSTWMPFWLSPSPWCWWGWLRSTWRIEVKVSENTMEAAMEGKNWELWGSWGVIRLKLIKS